jgi:hypothetical protein
VHGPGGRVQDNHVRLSITVEELQHDEEPVRYRVGTVREALEDLLLDLPDAGRTGMPVRPGTPSGHQSAEPPIGFTCRSS